MSKQFSILVIDNDEQYAKELISYVKTQDYIISADYSPNGGHGIDAAAIINPDVIILDSFMPHLDGLDFLRKINKCGGKPIVIMNSDVCFPGLITASMQNRADYFMIKPQPHSEVCKTALDLFSEGSLENTAK